jgi:pyruvate dehydrogenase E2 component (dihydrolipoamide acetyltransferase)
MANVDYDGPAPASAWRRLAVGSWGELTDPQIYGLIDLDARAMLARIEAERAAGVRLTVTQLVGRGIAEALRRCPSANVVLRRRRVWQRASVDVFMHVAVPAQSGDPSKAELSGVKIDRADQLDLRAFVAEFEQQLERTRVRRDQAIDRTRTTVARIPRLLLRPLLRLTQWLTYDLNLDLSRFGVARDPFGSVAVTSVGMLGIETAFAPLYPIGGPPVLLTVGAISPRPIVDEHGAIVARPILRIAGTFDHRVVDGVQIAKLAGELRAILEVEVADAWRGSAA